MKGKIHIAGLGPGSKEYISLGVLDLLKAGKKVYLRTEQHPVVRYLKEQGIGYRSFDYLYEAKSSFEEIYENIAVHLVDEANSGEEIVYAVPGSPLVAEKSVELILNKIDDRDRVDIIPSVSFLDLISKRFGLAHGDVELIDALNIETGKLTGRDTIIAQVYNRMVASEVKLKLMEVYPDDFEVFLIMGVGIKGMEKVEAMPLYEIDRQDWINHLTSVYVPKIEIKTKKRFIMDDLMEIMQQLRGEKGCPWDLKQNHESLKHYLIEETYEVIEAIDEKNMDKLMEELGDLLLQIVFHARIAEENNGFNFNDVVTCISAKMIRRHPHVFGKVKADTPHQVLINWDKIKRAEKGLKSYAEMMKDVPRHLPALMRAAKVQEKAAKVGFDWEKVDEAQEKLFEEVNELKEVYKTGDRGKIKEEIGDVFFAAVNVARLLKIEPEMALKDTITKFISRFSLIEKLARQSNRGLEEMTLEEMDALWDKAKTMLNKEKNNKKRQV